LTISKGFRGSSFLFILVSGRRGYIASFCHKVVQFISLHRHRGELNNRLEPRQMFTLWTVFQS